MDDKNKLIIFRNAPIQLQVYIIFSILMTILFFLMISQYFRPIIRPYLGSNFATHYMISIYFAFYFIYTRKKSSFNALIGFQGFGIIIGIIKFLTNIENISNPIIPFFKTSIYQPLFTILPPVIWILLFILPNVRKYYKVKIGDPR